MRSARPRCPNIGLLTSAYTRLALNFLSHSSLAYELHRLTIHQLSIFSFEREGLVNSPMPIQQARLLADYLSFLLFGHYPVVEDVCLIVKACARDEHLAEDATEHIPTHDRWKHWIRVEERRRLAYGHIMLACLATTALATPHSSVQATLASAIYTNISPASASLWDRANTGKWLEGPQGQLISTRSLIVGREMAATILQMEEFPAVAAQLALDLLAGDALKARTRAIRRDSADVAAWEEALWTLVDLQDQLLNPPFDPRTGEKAGISDTIQSRLMRHLGCISSQIPLLLLRSFARKAERADDETLELIRICVMKDSGARGRRMLLAGAQAWLILEGMSVTQMNENNLTPFVLFYATCAIYLQAYMTRLANASGGESDESIPTNAERLYLDKIAPESTEVQDWMKGKTKYLPCLLGQSYLRGGGSLLKQDTLSDLVRECAKRLRQLSCMRVHAEAFIEDLCQLPGL